MKATVSCSLLAACALHAIWASDSSAQTIPFPPLAPVLNSHNRHYYQVVQTRFTGISFEDALSQAESSTHLGIRGHLVTVTSQAEQDFLVATYAHTRLSQWLWIGASDAATEGEWRWVSGPEKKELFWLGSEDGIALGFHSWAGYGPTISEPNNFRNSLNGYQNENYAAIRLFHPTEYLAQLGIHAVWNDVASLGSDSYQPEGYIIEYSPVPEPSASVLFIVGALIAISRWKKQRA